MCEYRRIIKWSENGNSVQASPHQRASDHLPPLLPTCAHVLCYFILQTHLL